MASPRVVTAGLLLIGDEILSGRTRDANLQHIALRLNGHGVVLKEVRVVGDDRPSIVEHLRALKGAYDHVVTTGGIGPTHDDITSLSVAEALGLPLEAHPEALAMMASWYAGKGLEFNAARRRMVMMPQGSELLANPISMSPGYSIRGVHVLAGVPKIMEVMLEDLLSRLEGGARVWDHTLVCDVFEGQIAQALEAVQGKFEGVSIGSYPSFSTGGKDRPQIALCARGFDRSQLAACVEELRACVRSAGGAIFEDRGVADGSAEGDGG